MKGTTATRVRQVTRDEGIKGSQAGLACAAHYIVRAAQSNSDAICNEHLLRAIAELAAYLEWDGK